VGRRSRLRHPTRFGNLSSQLKQFLDTLGGVWVQGLLVGDSSRSLERPRRDDMACATIVVNNISVAALVAEDGIDAHRTAKG
jgi:hypothetical protein